MTPFSWTRAGMLSVFSVVVGGLALSGSLGAQGQGSGGNVPDPDRFIVKFTNPAAGRAAVGAAGGQILLDLPEQAAAAAHLPARARQALSNNPNIEYIEPDAVRYPFAQTTPYGIAMVQANLVSDASAANRTVCIIDSGYDLAHEDLPVATGTNVTGTGQWSVDGCGHGTHVAGTIAALTNDLGVVGVLPNGKVGLHIVKVFGSSCSWAYSSSLVSAANICRNAGAHIISMSLGGSTSTITERSAFQGYYDNDGILSVAAAGNAGNTAHSYPASYDSVVSVAAIDSAKAHASFSQRTNQVELAAPGVAVRSTVGMNAGTEESLTVSDTGYEVVGMEGTPSATGTGALVDCGLGTSACAGAAGKVCLIQRGQISFADKVRNCQAGGGVGAVIYNNAEALFSGTLGGTVTTIPSVGTSGTTGAILLGRLGQPASVTTGPGHYSFYDGTSMATPHVSGVAALVWSHNTTWTNAQIRSALTATAEDLGAAGRDNSFGWGLVRAKAALDHLNGGGTEPPPPPDPTFTLTVTKSKQKGVNVANLSWSGSTATSFDVTRNGSILVTMSGSSFADSGLANKSTHTYQVCHAGTTTCSNSVTITF
jgi:serine protease